MNHDHHVTPQTAAVGAHDAPVACESAAIPIPATLTLSAPLYRHRTGLRTALTSDPTSPPPKRPKATKPKPLGPSRLAYMLALAHKWTAMLDAGEVESQSALAAMYGLTRARVTQILNLAVLPHTRQEFMLTAHTDESTPAMSERGLRGKCQSRPAQISPQVS